MTRTRYQQQQQKKAAVNARLRHRSFTGQPRPYLYFAYGSNLNLEQMALRCPGAELVCPYEIPDWTLVFKRVADIERHQGGTCTGAVFTLTDSDEAALDVYEGFPRLYDKYFIFDDTMGPVMFYRMTQAGGYQMPSWDYFECIEAGYQQVGLDPDTLFAAIALTDELRPKHTPSYGTQLSLV